MSVPMHSRWIGRLLGLVLAMRMLLVVFELTAALIMIWIPQHYDRFGKPLDDMLMASWAWALYSSVAILTIWVYQYHRDLGRTFPGYPISPAGSLARALIPIYNFWGFWNIWDTASSHLDSRPFPRIRVAIIFFYLVWICSGIWGRISVIQHWPWTGLVERFLDVSTYVAVVWAASSAIERFRPVSTATQPEAI